MDPDSRERRAGQAGLPSETRQMAESDRVVDAQAAAPYALVVILLAVVALVVLWLVTR